MDRWRAQPPGGIPRLCGDTIRSPANRCELHEDESSPQPGWDGTHGSKMEGERARGRRACRARLKLIAVDLLILTCRWASWPTPGQLSRIARWVMQARCCATRASMTRAEAPSAK